MEGKIFQRNIIQLIFIVWLSSILEGIKSFSEHRAAIFKILKTEQEPFYFQNRTSTYL